MKYDDSNNQGGFDLTIQRRIFFSNILMIVLTLVLGAIVFFAARVIMVDDYTTTRGGSGGRFADFLHIPAISKSNMDEVFAEGS